MRFIKSKYQLLLLSLMVVVLFSCSKGDEPVPMVDSSSEINNSSMREGDVVDEDEPDVTPSGKDGAGINGDDGGIVGGDDNEDDDDVDVKGDVIGGSNGSGGGVSGGGVSGGGR